MINNRHIAPNTQEIFETIQPDLTAVLEQMYGGNDFAVELASEDVRERFAVQISARSNKGISDLLANLENH
jgi:translation initiation factor IF-2